MMPRAATTELQSPLCDAYFANREALKRFLIARTGSPEDAEDLVQEMFFRVREERHDIGIQAPLAYLYRMALNLAHDRRRAQRRSEARDGHWIAATQRVSGTDSIVDEPEAESILDAKAKMAKFVSALNALPPQCRTVFWLHKIDGFSHSEVAQKLGIARSTVEKHMSAALRRLVRHLHG